MKCDELIEKIKQADDDYRHKFIPINLDIEIEDVLGAFEELKAKLDEKESWVKMLGEGEAALSLELEKTKQKLENVQASAYAESVDAGMRERRLRRALLLMCARLGKMGSLAYHNIKAKLFFFDDTDGVKWALRKREQWENVERKCLKKAEEYK